VIEIHWETTETLDFGEFLIPVVLKVKYTGDPKRSKPQWFTVEIYRAERPFTILASDDPQHEKFRPEITIPFYEFLVGKGWRAAVQQERDNARND